MSVRWNSGGSFHWDIEDTLLGCRRCSPGDVDKLLGNIVPNLDLHDAAVFVRLSIVLQMTGRKGDMMY